jgi:hypothetical protein
MAADRFVQATSSDGTKGQRFAPTLLFWGNELEFWAEAPFWSAVASGARHRFGWPESPKTTSRASLAGSSQSAVVAWDRRPTLCRLEACTTMWLCCLRLWCGRLACTENVETPRVGPWSHALPAHSKRSKAAAKVSNLPEPGWTYRGSPGSEIILLPTDSYLQIRQSKRV